MNKEDWETIQRWEDSPNIKRVNEYVDQGPRAKPFLFAVRYFRRPSLNNGWVEIGYYIPMMQPEGRLHVFGLKGRKWSDDALRNVGLWHEKV